MRILVTGASGFLDTRLMRRLQHGGGHELFVLPSPHFQAGRLSGCRYRVVERASGARPEVIYHLAGPSMDAPESEHELATHVAMGRLLEDLQTARVSGPLPRLVFAGTGAEYGTGHGWTETHEPRPDTALGRAKLAAAERARSAHGVVHLVHLRLFTPFGEGEARSRLIPTAMRAATAGQPIRLRSTGEQTRDYLDAADAVEALVAAGARALEPGVIINICSGTPRRAVDVARQIAGLAGRGSTVETNFARPRALAQSSGVNTRAAELLGWRPAIAFEDSLTRILDWTRKEFAAA